MPQTIKVTSPFATPYDTARVLGVSKSRTAEIIKRVRKITDRMLHRDTVAGEFHAKKSAMSSAKSNGRRNASTKAHKTKAKARS